MAESAVDPMVRTRRETISRTGLLRGGCSFTNVNEAAVRLSTVIIVMRAPPSLPKGDALLSTRLHVGLDRYPLLWYKVEGTDTIDKLLSLFLLGPLSGFTRLIATGS